MVATLFLSGVQFLCVGILGDYVGRGFAELKARPLFLIDDERSRLSDSTARLIPNHKFAGQDVG